MNHSWPTMSPLASHRTCLFRIMFIASYPAIVRNAPSTPTEPKIRGDALLDETMILLPYVIQVGTWPALAMTAQFVSLLQFGDSGRYGAWPSTFKTRGESALHA